MQFVNPSLSEVCSIVTAGATVRPPQQPITGKERDVKNYTFMAGVIALLILGGTVSVIAESDASERDAYAERVAESWERMTIEFEKYSEQDRNHDILNPKTHR